MDLQLEQTDIESLDFQALKTLEPQNKAKDEAWFKARKGKFTASEFYKLMAYPDKSDFPKGAESYVIQKLVEQLTEVENIKINTPAVQWGLDHETEAVERFIKETGLAVYDYGEEQKFIEYENYAGGTPDGLIGETMGIEIKCPNSVTHLKYSLISTQEEFKKVCKEYYWQIQGYMLITERKRWYFVSYDPRFHKTEHQIKILTINRDIEDIENLKRRLIEAYNLSNNLI